MKNRIITLDLLRTSAALIIVIYHYQHFSYYQSEPFYFFEYSKLPFFDNLIILYNNGYLAVYFFFVLSGFIFYYVYFESIEKGYVKFKTFFIKRFSRLYPLHISTLIFVALLQIVYVSLFSKPFIYGENNLKNFILHLFLINHWGVFENSYSFNGPAWSLSVEEFAYIIFFISSLIYKKFVKKNSLLFLITLFFIFFILRLNVENPNNFQLFYGILCFFIGGVYSKIFQLNNKKLLIFFPLIHGVAAYFLYIDYFWKLFFFPAFILITAMLDKYLKSIIYNFGSINEISFTLYLMHFPIQLIVVLIDFQFKLNINFVSYKFFILYIIFNVAISTFIYKYFENHYKKKIRTAFKIN